MSMAALRTRRVILAVVGGGGGGTAFLWLAPLFTQPMAITGMAMVMDPATGRMLSTTVDTTEPTWATTVTISDTGTAAGNRAAIQSWLNANAASVTQNTKVIVPDWLGRVIGPYRSHSSFIGLYTPYGSLLPSTGAGTFYGTKENRVHPSFDAAAMTKADLAANNEDCFQTENGAQGYYLRGIHFRNPSNFQCYGMASVNCQSGETVSANYPERITLSQCLFDGGTGQNVVRAVILNGRKVAVVDCYGHRLGAVGLGGDSQFVCVQAGEGPYKISNNAAFVGGPSENVLVGGTSLAGTTDLLLPCDGEVRGNLWGKESFGLHKNYTEIKYGRRWLIEGNDCFGHNGGGQQSGLYITLTDQEGPNTATDTSDITVRLNRQRDGTGGLNVAGAQFYSGTNRARRIEFAGNLLYDLIGSIASHRPINIAQVDTMPDDVVMRFNTAIAPQSTGYPGLNAIRLSGDGSATRWSINYNVLVGSNLDVLDGTVWSEAYGVPGVAAVTSTATSSQFLGNLTTGTALHYAGNIIPPGLVNGDAANVNRMGFVSYAARDLSLAIGSPGYQAGPDGQDIGAPIALLNALMAQVS